MRDIRVAAAQFEARDSDKEYNLGRIRELTRRAVHAGAEIVSFHECSISGYTFLQNLDRGELSELAEPVPGGRSVQRLCAIATEFGVVLAAGLVEIDEHGLLYNTYAVVSPAGYVGKFSKLHPFISPHLSAGTGFKVLDLRGCKIGILICYDCNLPENVRATTLLGADIILMPHVTGGLPSPMPGRGKVDPEVWRNRHRDPVRCRQEFQGPKGRGWLMRWLPTRAYENGVYAVFSNAIGVDADTIKPGNAMIIDPFGEILAESSALDDDVVVALLTPEKIDVSPGRRYIRSRRPELYSNLVEPVCRDDRRFGGSAFAEVDWKSK